MRGTILYVLVGMFTMLGLDLIAPPGGLGLPIGAWPTIEQKPGIQWVDRSHKGDRLDLLKSGLTSKAKNRIGGNPAPAKPVTMPVGCEAAFSPLSSAAKIATVANRCVAEIDRVQAG